ncbi:putative quinol monooxygenase [Kitasatospora sp. CM 4170]|uniref:Quinol monooxygenase n=1 Tax=Kitasatospora aburaviensis TaxID=67265 RepID=A0ABW1F3D2_9ACTN|nr:MULTISPECIES: putative quinol monooxygenase [unclassified Kitasatospora]MCG6494726.1 antibiotic biosynthesis monooxygenase [Kitasatospora sp. A2-31]WNM46903.1 putative quinol monooxygenase [Kitasatospora sp. CM 4170]
MSRRITAVAVLRAKAGREADVRAQAAVMAAASLAEPGCISYRNYVDPDDPRSWVVVEEWASREAFEKHLTSPHLARSVELTSELLDGPPELRVLKAAV